MVKHYYRLVYWKRRLLGAGRAGGGVRGSSAYRRPRWAAGTRARISAGARPVLVFAVIVGIVLALSALLGGIGGPGPGRFGGGL